MGSILPRPNLCTTHGVNVALAPQHSLVMHCQAMLDDVRGVGDRLEGAIVSQLVLREVRVGGELAGPLLRSWWLDR